MSGVERLFEQYKQAHLSGAGADPGPFLEQLRGADRALLAGLIDAYLEHAPRRGFDPQAFRESAAAPVAEAVERSLGGQAGLWPALLPRLRAQAQIKRADLVRELAARLGAQSKQDKVASYYHEMEQGLLPAAGVSDAVLEALGAVLGLGKEALRSAGAMPSPAGPAPEPGVVFARTSGEKRSPGSAGSPAQEESEPDEVDRLFRGG